MLESSTFRDISPCSLVKVNRHFGETYQPCHHGRTVRTASSILNNAFLLPLFLTLKDGGDMFLHNVGWHSSHYIQNDNTLQEKHTYLNN
jgi:hypothetical protein